MSKLLPSIKLRRCAKKGCMCDVCRSRRIKIRDKQIAWRENNLERDRRIKREYAERAYRKMKQALLDRDGDVCAWCGEVMEDPISGQSTHIDHIIPKSKGGKGSIYKLPPDDNLRLLHADCNIERSDVQSDTEESDEVPF